MTAVFLKKALLFVLLATLPFPAYSAWGDEVFKWRDGSGKLHFSDNPNRVPITERNRTHLLAPSGPIAYRTPAVETTKVSLDYNTGAVHVPVRINGEHSIPLLLDTGASYCQITQDDALTLRLDLENNRYTKVLLADGREHYYRRVTVESLRIGSFVVNDVDFLVGDVRLLGLNVLKKFRVTLDMSRGEFVLERP